jgi:hypothetical protein
MTANEVTSRRRTCPLREAMCSLTLDVSAGRVYINDITDALLDELSGTSALNGVPATVPAAQPDQPGAERSRPGLAAVCCRSQPSEAPPMLSTRSRPSSTSSTTDRPSDSLRGHTPHELYHAALIAMIA